MGTQKKRKMIILKNEAIMWKSNNYEFIIFVPKDNQFGRRKTIKKKINFNIYNEKKVENIVSNYLFNENNLNLTKFPIYPREITVSDIDNICI